MSEKEDVIGWCVLEQMGHRRLGCFMRPVELAGKGFLRIDVPTPETKDESGPWLATQLINPDSVYQITPTTIEMAKAAAARSVVEPVARWELPAAKEPERVVRGTSADDRDEDDELSDMDPADLPRF